MTPEDRAAWELARDSGNWRWVDSLLVRVKNDSVPWRVIGTRDGWVHAVEADIGEWDEDEGAPRCEWPAGPRKGITPVHDDPATLGAMLGLVRELWGETGMHVRPSVDLGGRVEWRVYHSQGSALLKAGRWCPTEFAALCHAIAAAPQQPKEG